MACGAPLFWVGLTNFQRWAMVEPIIRDELDAHAPAGVTDQQTAEGGKRQFVVVDTDNQLAVFVIVNLAAQHAAAGDPLVAWFEISHLR
jgi:hypothetical protein